MDEDYAASVAQVIPVTALALGLELRRIGRAFTDTFADIAPASTPGFGAAQLVDGVVAAALAWWYPIAADVVVPHGQQEATP